MGMPTNQIPESELERSLNHDMTVRRARNVADLVLATRFQGKPELNIRSLALGFRALDMPDGKELADPAWLTANRFVLANGLRPTYFSEALVPNPTKPAGYNLPVLAISFPFAGQPAPTWSIHLFGHETQQNWHPNREWVRTMAALLRTLGYDF